VRLQNRINEEIARNKLERKNQVDEDNMALARQRVADARKENTRNKRMTGDVTTSYGTFAKTGTAAAAALGLQGGSGRDMEHTADAAEEMTGYLREIRDARNKEEGGINTGN
jgi:hypothetical protein